MKPKLIALLKTMMWNAVLCREVDDAQLEKFGRSGLHAVLLLTSCAFAILWMKRHLVKIGQGVYFRRSWVIKTNIETHAVSWFPNYL